MKRIDIFPWDDNFATGIEAIDVQHRRLVEIINDLASRFAFDGSEIDLGTVFDELLDYTDYHFTTEEGIWQTYLDGDPSLAEHCNNHRRFIESLKELVARQEGRSVAEIAEGTLEFLVRWLVSHILESDRYMAYTVAALQDGVPVDSARAQAAERMSGYTRKMIDIILSIYGTLSHNTLRLMQELTVHQVMEKRLEFNEQLLRTVIDELPDVLLLKDARGNYLLANKTLADLYGTTPEAMVGGDDSPFVPAGMAEFFKKNVLEVMERGRTETVYEDARDAETGETRHFKSIKKPFHDAQGNRQILVIAHDITEEIRARDELQRHRAILQTLVRAIPDLIWLKDAEGVYLTCNERFESFFGATEAQIRGRTDYDFVDRELADLFREHDRMAMAKNGPSVNEEWITFASDGHRELLETTKMPMYSEEGMLIGILGIGHDVTAQHEAEEKLMQSEQSFRSLFDSLIEAVYVQDAEGRFLTVNRGAERLYNRDREWFTGKTPLDIAAEGYNDLEALAEAHRRAVAGEPQRFEFWAVTAEGKIFPKEVHLTRGTWFGKEVVFAVALEITERKKHQEELEHIAHYDPLTGLPNRLLLADRMHQAIALADRHKTLLAVVYLDLDGFKAINDLHGHETGDGLLITLARRMKQALREEDTLARLGGDEFVAILQDLGSVEAAEPVLERLLDAASSRVQAGEYDLRVSASLGVTFYPQGDEEIEPDHLIRQSDQAMYLAKQAGKNCYHLFDAEHDRNMRSRHESIERIRIGLEKGEFVLHYQPKVNMRTGRVYGVEALIRWQHPQRGMLSPAEFLPAVENHPLVVTMGIWVLETALSQIEAWREAGLNLQVSVNIDGMHLQQVDFVEALREMMAAHPGVRRGDLELEVLETSALSDIEHVIRVMTECRTFGVEFAIDDFGTGYSSLTYLKRLPAHTLKIDKSFVIDLLDDSEDLAIVEGIMGLSKVFRRVAVAEGVESVAHGELLLQLGCTLAQGYAIARPMPASELPAWIESWKPAPGWLA